MGVWGHGILSARPSMNPKDKADHLSSKGENSIMKIDANRLRAFVKSHGLTNTNLAARDGITRQALQAMLRENHVVEVRDRTVKGLVQALRLADESLLSPDPLAGFKKAVAEDNADLNFAGLGLPTT